MADWIPVDEAARLLDCSPRSFYRYSKRGLVRAKHEGRRLWIFRDDVTQLKVGRRDVLNSPYTKDVITKLLLEVQQLRSQMATVMRLLNINYKPLELSDSEYKVLWMTAEQLSQEGWSPHMEEDWADTFVRIKVEDLDKLEVVTGDPHPWRPFLRLATAMHLRPWNTRLRDMFGSGRSNVHQVGSMWCVLKEKTQREFGMLVERDTNPPRKLLRRLSKEQDA